MNTLAIHSVPPTGTLIRPEPRSGPITIRLATANDVTFIDDLHKKHSRMVGFLPLSAITKRIEKKQVVIAADEAGNSIGYCIFEDCYMKHEDVGVCYQLNVAPHKQRGLVGAALIKAVFERMPYGVKLFCCWCAQDIQANHFWESLGFVPLAFRAGSRGVAQGGRRKEGRIHIFWQRRIREGDTGAGATPYWYPSETKGGALKEDRIVLPIPPGKHWSDELLLVLPGVGPVVTPHALPEGEVAAKPKRERKKAPQPPTNPISASGGLWFAPPTPPAESIEDKSKPKREKPPKQKNDPKLVAAAREFRDRYLDEVNSGRHLLEAQGKYDVSRQLAAGGPPVTVIEQMPLLNAA